MTTGGTVDLRVALANETGEIVLVETGPGMTARITDARGVVVWQDPPAERDGIIVGIPAIGCPRFVVPAQPFEFGVTWDLKDADGRSVPPGEYVAHLHPLLASDLPAPDPLRITVVPGPKAVHQR